MVTEDFPKNKDTFINYIFFPDKKTPHNQQSRVKAGKQLAGGLRIVTGVKSTGL